MGFLDRAINAVALPFDHIAIVDRSFKRAEKVFRDGGQASGLIVGIERRHNDDTTTEVLAVQVTGGPRAGVQPLVNRPEHLRLGMPVLVRCVGDRAVLDWPAMCARWGVDPGSPGQRLKDPPADGIRDRALDSRVQRRLGRWTPARAVIAGFEEKTVFGGMAIESWPMRLGLAGGGEIASTGGHFVPFYARWLAAPGVEVPVAVDPEDPARCVVDWAAAAQEWAARAGAMDDQPPPGSIAAAEHQRRAVHREATDAPAVASPPPELAPIHGVTLEQWAAIEAGVVRDRVPPEDYDAYAQTHGVAPGARGAADAGWKTRMIGDWRVGAQMGAAVEAARKRR